ncbi:MAG TPA: hypothetical protein VGF23_25050 [Gaiellaceae bacterium]
MHIRTILPVVAAAAAVAAASAHAGGLPGTRCGAFSAAGHTWVVIARGLGCGDAEKVISGLAAKPVPRNTLGVYPGIFLGMRCVHIAAGTRLIVCGNSKKHIHAAAPS